MKSKQEEQNETLCPSLPNCQPCSPLFTAWRTESGTTCSCTGYTHSRLPQKQPPTHFLPLQSNKALFSLVLSLPAVWFQSQGCHIRQLSLSNSICGERSSRCTTADMQVLKSPPTLVLICSQLKGIESNKDCSIRASMKHQAETHRS